MTNLRKCLSASAFAFFALALCGLVIGQAVVAKVQTEVTAAGSGNAIAIDRNIPLPVADLRGDQQTATQSQEPGVEPDAVMYDRLDHLPMIKAPKSVSDNKGSGTFVGGDGPGDATAITALPFSDTDTNVGASDLVSVDCGYGAPSGVGDVWYSYTPAANEWISISMCATYYDGGVGAYDFMLILYEDDYTLGAINCDDDYCAVYGASAIPYQPVFAGHTYYIVVDGWAENTFTLDVTAASDPYTDACNVATYNEVETCGSHTNDGCWIADPPTAADVEQVDPNDLICGTTYQAGTTTGLDREGDMFRFTLANEQIVTITAMFELESRLYLYEDPLATDNCFTTVTTASGDNAVAVTLPANVPFFWTGTLPAGSYAIAQRANLEAGDCGTGPFAADYRFFVELTARDIIPLDDCGGAQTISGAGTWTFDNTGFNNDGGMAHDLWFRWSPSDNCYATLSLCGTTAIDDTRIAIYPEGCPADGLIAYNDDACGASGWEAELTDVLALDVNYYMIQIGTWGEEGAGELVITQTALPPQLGDACASGPVVLGTGDQHEFFYNTGATTDGPTATSYCYDPDDASTIGQDLWFLWTASTNGPVTAGVCDVDYDGRMEVYEGAACPSVISPRQPVACDDDGCIDEWSAPPVCDWIATAGTDYLIRIGNWENLPDYPGAGSAGYLDITEGASIPHPANDYCVDAVPLSVTLAGGSIGDYDEVAALGSLEHAMYYDCPYASDGGATIWYSITFDVCAYVAIYYCGSTTLNYVPYDVQKLWNGCPCTPDEGTEILADNSAYLSCGSTLAGIHEFNILPPGTYYIPVTRGVGGWATGKPDVQINVYVEAVDCQFCTAGGGALSCPASGSTWIEGITFGDLDRGYHSGAEISECTGYTDFTADAGVTVPTLYKGMTYAIAVTAAKNGGILDANDVMYAYFDWSQDASFYETGEAYPLTRVGQNYTGNITIPLTVGGPTGTTVLRVRITKASEGPNSPCGTTTWGEVEDYMLDIQDVPCGDFDHSGVVDIADVAAIKDLYFNAASTAPATWEMADATGDCVFNIADIIYLADYVYGRVTTLECFPCTPL